MRIFLGNGRGKGGGQGRGGDERPPSGTRKTGGRWNPKVPKRQAIGDSHPDGKGPPTGRSWDIHPQPSKRNIPRPTAPHTIGRVSSTASEEMLRSRRNEGPEIGRGMRRCTHRSTSRDVGRDDTPGSVGLTPSWNNHPFHSIPWIHRWWKKTSPHPTHHPRRKRNDTCECDDVERRAHATKRFPFQPKRVAPIPCESENPFGWWNGACLVLRRRNVQVETNTCPSKPTNDNKRDIRSCPTIPARKAARNLRQAQTSEKAAIPVLERRNDTSRPLVFQPTPTQGPINAM